MPFAQIYIVRHGQTEENRLGIIQGQLDTALNIVGLEQAKQVGAALQHVPFDAAFSSDLNRAANTANVILGHHPNVTLQVDAGLRERYMGASQGQTKFFKDANSETTEALVRRSHNWWTSTILSYLSTVPDRSTPYNILVVSHGGLICTLVPALVASRKITQPNKVKVGQCGNVSISIIEMKDRRKGVLKQFGDMSHVIEQVVSSNADIVE